jgi:2,4-dienoyl-CoA reductase-like NADH-dependent reductase (Old Yellow Enzyme family)/thioredoxin reductase
LTTAASFDLLFRPGKVGGLELPNRVLMAPMEKNLCTAEGIVTQRYIDYLVARARGGVGLLRCEATYVDPVGKGRPYQLGAHSDAVVPELTRMVDAVHEAGGRMSVELAHCGRQTNAVISGHQPVAPSPVPCELSGGYVPRELTVGEIEAIVERFAEAAARAERAGMDAVEIHGASGYLINAFTSPYTNLREDEYGGSPENRWRFALEVVAAIRATIAADTPLLYRIDAEEFVPGGLTAADTAPLAAALERAGVDLIDVSAGTYESITATQPPMEEEPGSLLEIAATIKAALSIPVATAGKLADLDVAERALREGIVDFITIGRGLHAEPELVRKAQEGRLDEARRCIACAECVAFLGEDLPAYCAINPATAREGEASPAPVAAPRKVVVVGAGPAGLEAARVARLRGHEVSVFERQDASGGRVRLGMLAAGRAAFGDPIVFLCNELDRLGVPVAYGTEVTGAMAVGLAADVVVVATGGRPHGRSTPAPPAGRVLDGDSYLAMAAAGSREASLAGTADSAPVAVIGGSWTGCHIAALLLEAGRRVILVETRETLGYDMGDQQGMVLRDRVADLAEVRLGATLEELSVAEITIWDSADDRRETLEIDGIVVASGLESDSSLRDEIVARVGDAIEVHEIGDCALPRKLADALLDGATVAARI